MTPTQVILDELQTLLNTDTTTLGAAAVKHVHLIMAPFTPGLGTDLAALTVATFVGSTPLNAPSGNQRAYRDPVTGQNIVELISPAGGWHWQATAGTSLPQTIYGYCVTDASDAVTYGSGLLATPVTIQASGDGLDIPQVAFNFIPPVLD